MVLLSQLFLVYKALVCLPWLYKQGLFWSMQDVCACNARMTSRSLAYVYPKVWLLFHEYLYQPPYFALQTVSGHGSSHANCRTPPKEWKGGWSIRRRSMHEACLHCPGEMTKAVNMSSWILWFAGQACTHRSIYLHSSSPPSLFIFLDQWERENVRRRHVHGQHLQVLVLRPVIFVANQTQSHHRIEPKEKHGMRWHKAGCKTWAKAKHGTSPFRCLSRGAC
jgi:hypothetical protein